MTITETTQLIVGAFVVFTMGIIVGSAGGPPASPERRRPACIDGLHGSAGGPPASMGFARLHNAERAGTHSKCPFAGAQASPCR